MDDDGGDDDDDDDDKKQADNDCARADKVIFVEQTTFLVLAFDQHNHLSHLWQNDGDHDHNEHHQFLLMMTLIMMMMYIMIQTTIFSHLAGC